MGSPSRGGELVIRFEQIHPLSCTERSRLRFVDEAADECASGGRVTVTLIDIQCTTTTTVIEQTRTISMAQSRSSTLDHIARSGWVTMTSDYSPRLNTW